MPNTIWRCVHPDGDVKLAVRQDHVNKLEVKGYVCELSPDEDYSTLLPVDPDSDDGTG